jgi:HK97 family phage prohead protease
MPDMYWMHDPKEPVGSWIDMGEDAKGLMVEGQIWTGDAETECSRKAYNVASGTGIKGLSIGYKTKAASRDQKSGARRLEVLALSEISIVGAQAMNPRATVLGIKSIFADGQVPSIRELEDMLRDAGMSATQAKALLAGGYKSLPRDEGLAHTAEQEIAELLRIRRALRGEDD